MNTCAYCKINEADKKVKSHIIPKFLTNRIRGENCKVYTIKIVRGSYESLGEECLHIQKKSQDFLSINGFYCKACEDSFATNERLFANNFHHPIINNYETLLKNKSPQSFAKIPDTKLPLESFCMSLIKRAYNSPIREMKGIRYDERVNACFNELSKSPEDFPIFKILLDPNSLPLFDFDVLEGIGLVLMVDFYVFLLPIGRKQLFDLWKLCARLSLERSGFIIFNHEVSQTFKSGFINKYAEHSKGVLLKRIDFYDLLLNEINRL